MRILLIGNYGPDGQVSMLRFEALMRDGLGCAGHQVETIRPPAVLGRFFPPGFRGVGKWAGYLDKYVLFPVLLRAAASRRADVVHICDHSNAMYSSWVGATPCLVTCHDMLAVRGALGEQTDCPASLTGRWLQRWIVRGLRKATAIAAVSSATAADVERIVGAGPQKTRILLAVNSLYRRLPREQALARLADEFPHLDPRRPFVLHVGSNLVRKNRPGVIRSFARAAVAADLQLVLAGPPLPPQLHDLIRSQGVADRVQVVVRPSNEGLLALYNLALVLLFPSRFEGFGWPLIEAQACGCPVICSRCAPFAEVVGGAAIVRAADDEQGYAEAIVRLARDEHERETWSAAGLRNAERFAPRRLIADYTQLYCELLERRPVAGHAAVGCGQGG